MSSALLSLIIRAGAHFVVLIILVLLTVSAPVSPLSLFNEKAGIGSYGALGYSESNDARDRWYWFSGGVDGFLLDYPITHSSQAMVLFPIACLLELLTLLAILAIRYNRRRSRSRLLYLLLTFITLGACSTGTIMIFGTVSDGGYSSEILSWLAWLSIGAPAVLVILLCLEIKRHLSPRHKREQEPSELVQASYPIEERTSHRNTSPDSDQCVPFLSYEEGGSDWSCFLFEDAPLEHGVFRQCMKARGDGGGWASGLGPGVFVDKDNSEKICDETNSEIFRCQCNDCGHLREKYNRGSQVGGGPVRQESTYKAVRRSTRTTKTNARAEQTSEIATLKAGGKSDRAITLEHKYKNDSKQFFAPLYKSWTSKSPTEANSYKHWYNFVASNFNWGDKWVVNADWILVHGTDWSNISENVQEIVNQNRSQEIQSKVGGEDYATEHIYEIQQVSHFLASMRGHLGNNKLVDLLCGKTQFCYKDYYGIGQNLKRPIDHIMEQLSRENTDDFVYLESSLNGTKGVFFNGQNDAPGIEFPISCANLLAVLDKAARAALVIKYLNEAEVSERYRRVSLRVYEAFKHFHKACQNSHLQGYKNLSGHNLPELYKSWESEFLDTVEKKIRDFIMATSKEVVAWIDSKDARSLPKVDRARLETLKGILGPQDKFLGTHEHLNHLKLKSV